MIYWLQLRDVFKRPDNTNLLTKNANNCNN